jgi:hypothetical protein
MEDYIRTMEDLSRIIEDYFPAMEDLTRTK